LVNRYLLIILLTLVILGFGCKSRKILPVKEKKEIFEGVVDSSEKNLVKGKRGGTFFRADIPELDTLNIVTTRSKSVYNVLRLVFEGLLSTHPITGKITGGIAREYTVTNEGLSVICYLNRDVRFSDGTLCTADDVLFSFNEIYLNPDIDSRKTEALKIRDTIIKVEKIDDYTVRFDLPVPYRPFLYTLSHIQILPSHIIAPIIKEKGVEAFNREWGAPENNMHNVIGTGPYMIKEFKKGEYLKLVRNMYYTTREGTLYIEGMPYLDEIVEFIGLDNDTKLLKFQIGELDFYDIGESDISSGNLDTLLQNRSEGNYTLYSGGQSLLSNHFLVFNQNPVAVEKQKLSIFQKSEFRKAISHLIDRKGIMNQVYKGYAYIEGSSERNVSPFYKHQPTHPYDPERAKQLLSEVGLEDLDGDNYLNLPSGEKFGFTIFTNRDNPFRIKMGKMITESLNRAGLDVDLQIIDYDLLVTKLLDTFKWEAVIIGVEGSIEPNDGSWIWESKGPLHIWYPYQDSPATKWEKRVDELFALGRTTWSFEQAKQYYHEYQDIISQNLPLINIIVPAEIYGFRNRYGNVIPSAVTFNSLGIMPYIYKK